jgi:hypothetical protein
MNFVPIPGGTYQIGNVIGDTVLAGGFQIPTAQAPGCGLRRTGPVRMQHSYAMCSVQLVWHDLCFGLLCNAAY